jgi:hypothetical protein
MSWSFSAAQPSSSWPRRMEIPVKNLLMAMI